MSASTSRSVVGSGGEPATVDGACPAEAQSLRTVDTVPLGNASELEGDDCAHAVPEEIAAGPLCPVACIEQLGREFGDGLPAPGWPETISPLRVLHDVGV